MAKTITVALYSPRFESSWRYNWSPEILLQTIAEIAAQFAPLGVSIEPSVELDQELSVRGYSDLLNTVRLRSPGDNIANLCLGHVIGGSEACDLTADIRRGVRRIAFAPEMVEPEGENKKVCHNCGCGC